MISPWLMETVLLGCGLLLDGSGDAVAEGRAVGDAVGCVAWVDEGVILTAADRMGEVDVWVRSIASPAGIKRVRILLMPYASPPKITRLTAANKNNPEGEIRIVHPTPRRRAREEWDGSFCPIGLAIIGIYLFYTMQEMCTV